MLLASAVASSHRAVGGTRIVRSKGGYTMTIRVQQSVNQEQVPLVRTAIERLLQEAGSTEHLDLSGQHLQGVTLVNSDLRGANLSLADLHEANLCGANLAKVDLHGARLSHTYLSWANLGQANLQEVDLQAADLSWADLRGANLRGANLDQAILYGACLNWADLREAWLETADLRGAELTWASFGGAGTYARAKQDLQRRGALFREGTQVHCVVSRSDETDGYALGVVLGILVMGTVTFLFGRRVRSMLKQGNGPDRPRGGRDRS